MRYLLERTVDPTDRPLSQLEAQNALRIEDGEQVEDLTPLIESATAFVQDATNRQCIDATFRLSLRDWPSGRILYLPKTPLSSVTSIAYLDSDGASQTLSSALYTVTAPDGDTPPHGFLVLDEDEDWPALDYDTTPFPITVTFVAGYGSKYNEVPEMLKAAIKFRLRILYDGPTDQLEATCRSCWFPFVIR